MACSMRLPGFKDPDTEMISESSCSHNQIEFLMNAASAIDPTRKAIFGLYGAGGFAREVMPLCRQQLRFMSEQIESGPDIYFVETQPHTKELNGVSVISEQEFFELKCDERLFNVAIADSRIREQIADICLRRGGTPISLRSRDSIIYDNNQIGEGAILCAYSMVTSNARIGRFFHSNIHSYVAHDCVIGDFVTFAPQVHCNGNVHIHNHAYIGTGAIIRQGTSTNPLVIGEGAVVGMGAIVTKDVPPNTTVVGNPARPLEKK